MTQKLIQKWIQKLVQKLIQKLIKKWSTLKIRLKKVLQECAKLVSRAGIKDMEVLFCYLADKYLSFVQIRTYG